MFSGLVQGQASIIALDTVSAMGRLVVQTGGQNSEMVLTDLAIGDSIAIDGVCLTLVLMNADELSFDLSAETITRTTFAHKTLGQRVNLEKSLRADAFIGGHFVSGHVDAVVKVLAQSPRGETLSMTLETPQQLMKYIPEKGSVCLSGVSLTVNQVTEDSFSVMLIPQTLRETTLGTVKAGDFLNIEIDMMARYIEKLLPYK